MNCANASMIWVWIKGCRFHFRIFLRVKSHRMRRDREPEGLYASVHPCWQVGVILTGWYGGGEPLITSRKKRICCREVLLGAIPQTEATATPEHAMQAIGIEFPTPVKTVGADKPCPLAVERHAGKGQRNRETELFAVRPGSFHNAFGI